MGITFKNNLTWTYHLTLGKDAIVNKCRRKLGALKHVAKNASFSYRKRLADGCIMSVFTYGIQVWGLSVKKSTMNQVQIVQNMAACWILRMPWWTKTEVILQKVGWLSMYQTAYYQSLLLLWKVLTNREWLIAEHQRSSLYRVVIQILLGLDLDESFSRDKNLKT